MNISVILPAYNEQENIDRTVSRSLEALRPLFDESEIIIIDDASTDRTLEIAEHLAAAHPQIKVLRNERNLGQGLSQIRGFRSARYELVVHNGMDYPFDFRDLARMLPLLEDADVVVATRTARPGYSVYRRIVSWLNRMLIRVLFPLRIKDYNFVQLYRKKVLDAVKVEATSAGFVVPEILIRAHALGFRIRQVPCEYHRRAGGLATVGSPRVVLRSLWDLLTFRWKMRGFRR